MWVLILILNTDGSLPSVEIVGKYENKAECDQRLEIKAKDGFDGWKVSRQFFPDIIGYKGDEGTLVCRQV